MGLQSIKHSAHCPLSVRFLWSSLIWWLIFFNLILHVKSKMHVTRRGVHNGFSRLQEERCFHPFQRTFFFLLWDHPRLPQITHPIPEWPKPTRFSLLGHHDNFAHPIRGGIASPGNAWWGLEVLGSEVLFAHCLETASFIFLALFFFFSYV